MTWIFSAQIFLACYAVSKSPNRFKLKLRVGLLTPPRAIRREPSLCGSMIAFSLPNWCPVAVAWQADRQRSGPAGTMMEPYLKVCRACGKCSLKMVKCSTCKTFGAHFYYCGQECQKSDWPVHKGVHKRLKEESEKYHENFEKLKLLDCDSKTHDSKSNAMSEAAFVPVWLGISHTPLMQFSFEGNAVEVRRLLEEKSDPSALCKQGLNALFYAVAANRPQIVQILVDHECRLDLTLPTGATCLYYACEHGFETIVPILMKAGGATLLNKTLKDGSSCLYIACGFGHLSIATLIIDSYPSLLSKTGTNKFSCLHIACQTGQLPIVELLLNKPDGSALLRSRNVTGSTPLDVACEHGHLEIVRLLVLRGGTYICIHIQRFMTHVCVQAASCSATARPDCSPSSWKPAPK